MKRTLLALTMAACTGLAGCENEDLLGPEVSADATVVPAEGAAELTVMTRNIYLGFDIDGVIAAGAISNEAMMMALVQGWQDLHATDFTERAEALADEIAAARPHLVGLQEVITYRKQYPGDFILGNVAPNATAVEYDFLQILVAALTARGLDYEVVANNPTTDIEVPMPIVPSPAGPGDFMDVRYTDHDAILARGDVDVGDMTAGIYDDMLSFNLGPLPGYRPLGFVAVEAEVDGTSLVFVSTHLETQDHPEIQVAQTTELLEWIAGQELPVVLVGDFNSAANRNAPADKFTDSYQMLIDAGFQDLYISGNRQNPGMTCCHPTSLRGDNPFDQRLDLILYKGESPLVGGYHATIVGGNPSALTSTGMWPSDHAGVVATIQLPVGLSN